MNKMKGLSTSVLKHVTDHIDVITNKKPTPSDIGYAIMELMTAASSLGVSTVFISSHGKAPEEQYQMVREATIKDFIEAFDKMAKKALKDNVKLYLARRSNDIKH